MPKIISRVNLRMVSKLMNISEERNIKQKGKKTLLWTLEQFESLKKGDLIYVKWSDYFVKHHKESRSIMFYKIDEVKIENNEIICSLENNHYFNYKMYLELDTIGINTSQASEVWLIEDII